MIELRRITGSGEADFDRLMKLYVEAFPEEERREIDQLKRLIITSPEMYFNAVVCEGELSGLFVYWNLDGFYYLEHLAVYAEKRNKKIGQQVLDWVNMNLKGFRLLEVEPAGDEITRRRIAYYQRNGYRILDKDYIQPSYKVEEDILPLWIMGNTEYEDKNLLLKHIRSIKENAYYKPVRELK